MHAVVPHRVVAHVHSVNTIAWAVRQDAESELAEKLSGLRWHWIPYVPSGRPLAEEMKKVADHRPDTDVFVLGNHGLVICGEDCNVVEDLLGEDLVHGQGARQDPGAGIGDTHHFQEPLDRAVLHDQPFGRRLR